MLEHPYFKINMTRRVWKLTNKTSLRPSFSGKWDPRKISDNEELRAKLSTGLRLPKGGASDIHELSPI